MIEGLELTEEPDIERVYFSAAQVILLRGRGEEREVLLGKRNTRSYPEQWAFFGGWQDPEDSDLLATALRELREELNLVVSGSRLVPQNPIFFSSSEIVDGRIVSREFDLQPYILEAGGLNPKNIAPGEHSEIRWFGLGSAIEMHDSVVAAHPHVSRLDRDRVPGALTPRTAQTIRNLMSA